MLMPNGQSADKTDKIMLMSMWARTLDRERNEAHIKSVLSTKMITAGMGKPTYPMNRNTIAFYQAYWQRIEMLAKQAIENLAVVLEGSAIDYGDPQGDLHARALMAQAMTNWYKTEIKPEDILFTAGGAGALRTIFETFNVSYKDTPGYRIITPFPHNTLYSDNPIHRLHPIAVMEEPGYRLTARALEDSIQSAYQLAKEDFGIPKAILLCNPSNPLGTIIHEDELLEIAQVLRRYPELHIVLDEAYAEMCYIEMPSLLQIAPDLKERMVIMRSATKGLSAAGERMAILLTFNASLMSEFLSKSISLMGHTPRSSQEVYAKTMANLDSNETKGRVDFYKEKVDYVMGRLKDMGASMPDPKYQVEATFYVLTDLSDLFGLELPFDSVRALGKGGTVSTDEELAYYLLFKDHLMIAPLSYYGMPKEKGYMRITCSADKDELNELMNRLEARLLAAREAQQQAFLDDITQNLSEVKKLNKALYQTIITKIESISSLEKSCLSLKTYNQELRGISSNINILLQRSSINGLDKSAITLQSFFRGRLARKKTEKLKKALDEEWKKFVDAMFSEPCAMKGYFLGSSIEDRLKFSPWREHLKQMESENKFRDLHNP